MSKKKRFLEKLRLLEEQGIIKKFTPSIPIGQLGGFAEEGRYILCFSKPTHLRLPDAHAPCICYLSAYEYRREHQGIIDDLLTEFGINGAVRIDPQIFYPAGECWR